MRQGSRPCVNEHNAASARGGHINIELDNDGGTFTFRREELALIPETERSAASVIRHTITKSGRTIQRFGGHHAFSVDGTGAAEAAGVPAGASVAT